MGYVLRGPSSGVTSRFGTACCIDTPPTFSSVPLDPTTALVLFLNSVEVIVSRGFAIRAAAVGVV